MPAFATGAALTVNDASTVLSASMVTVHGSVPVHPSPDHPVKVEPGSDAGDRVTSVPEGCTATQLEPQSIPAGEPVTVPLPVPVLVTVRA